MLVQCALGHEILDVSCSFFFCMSSTVVSEVKVFDTCSSAEQSVKAALNALVKAQQGCQGPFFLGLLGPDDPDSLRAVAKVISVFHYPHVVLSTVKSFAQFNTLNVQIIEPSVSAKVRLQETQQELEI